MNITHHPKCNSALTPAPGTEADVAVLPIQRGMLQNVEVVRSFWKPTDAEIEVILAGGYVALTVWGHTHPPVHVGVSD